MSGHLEEAAIDELLGRNVNVTVEDEIALMRACDPESVREVLERAFDTMLLMRPSRLPPTHGFPSGLRRGSDVPVDGDPFGYWPDVPEIDDGRHPTVIVGDLGLTITYGRNVVSVLFDACVLALAGEDGSVSMFRDDGVFAWLPLSLLEHGDRLLEIFREALPPMVFADHDPNTQRWREIEALARTRLGPRSELWIDLTCLAERLRPHATVHDLATGSIQGSTGLVAVTDSEVIWCRGDRGDAEEVTNAVPFDRITSVATDGRGLTLAHEDGSERTIRAVGPDGRAAAFAEFISARLAIS